MTTPQNRSVAIGAVLASDATRQEQIGFFFAFKDLRERKGINTESCNAQHGHFLQSDLKFDDFLQKAVQASYQPEVLSRKPGKSPFSTFNYDVKFIITATGTVNPSWKLVDVTANQNSTLFSGTRVRTDDLLITMGAIEKEGPSQDVRDAHLATLIGQAVVTALESQRP